MKDLVFDKDYKNGDKGKRVRLIQEWLCLHGLNIAIDKDFGSATEYAVKKFQKKKGLRENGVVDQNTFENLIKPMKEVLKPISVNGKKLGSMVIAYARQHLKQHPVEVGGQNKGPWVRLYMDGKDGVNWPWCAGFVSFILKQACKSLDVPLPIQPSFSCDILAASAKEKELFVKGMKNGPGKPVKPGAIFLNRRTSTDWTHTGIVLKAESDIFHTIEGNTNDEGSREGYEVCQRIRGYGKRDFISI